MPRERTGTIERRNGRPMYVRVFLADSLRHSSCTWAAARGDQVFAIKAKSGHSDINTVNRYVERWGEVNRATFGEPFGALPEELLVGSSKVANRPLRLSTPRAKAPRAETKRRKAPVKTDAFRNSHLVTPTGLELVALKPKRKKAAKTKGSGAKAPGVKGLSLRVVAIRSGHIGGAANSVLGEGGA